MKHKVTVIIPAYNSECSIVRCIESCLGQSYNAVEIIVINDGSNDGTLNKLYSYGSKIFVIDQDNQGVGAARNTGIKHATGNYLYFLDADDYLEKKALEMMVTEMIRESSDLVVSGYKILSQEQSISSIKPRISSQFTPIDNFMLDNIISSPWAKLFKRDLIREFNINFSSHKIMQDSIFNVQYLTHVNKLAVCNESMYVYDKSMSTSTKSITDEKVRVMHSSLNLQSEIYIEHMLRRNVNVDDGILNARFFRLGVLFPLSSGANGKILIAKLTDYSFEQIILNKYLRLHEKILLLSLKTNIHMFKLTFLLLESTKKLINFIKR